MQGPFMDHVERLVRDLKRPAAYGRDARDVVLHQTHISLVFLAGEFAYKLKKPVDFGFVDYSSLDARRHFCDREVSLNRRLAPDVYLDVVPVVAGGEGLQIGDPERTPDARVVEWAVRMRRLDDADRLLDRLSAGHVPEGAIARLGSELAAFHARAERGADISRYGDLDQVRANTRGNFEDSRAHAGDVIPAELHRRAGELSLEALDNRSSLIRERADADVPADTHGDLRLEHVYVDEDGALTIVDCVEFNDAFRYADPVSDIAFLAMDLLVRGYEREAANFLDSWFRASGDDVGRQLLDFYVAYRSCVRAKVHGFKAADADVAADERDTARRRAGMHWRFAVAVLAPARERPRLLLVGGLPGTGKTTVARSLQDQGWLDEVVRSDVVRKELTGIAPDESGADDFGAGIYSAVWTRRTYEACRERAAAVLESGGRAAIDASFHEDGQRRACVAMARDLGVQPVFLECRLDAAAASDRLAARAGDASDADAAVHERMQSAWEAPSAPVSRVRRVLDTAGPPEAVAAQAMRLLEDMPVVPRPG